MRNRSRLDREGGALSNSRRALVAALFILGLTSLVWLHRQPAGVVLDEFGTNAATPTEATMPASRQSYLHAPTSDPSLPSLEATFSRAQAAPDDVAAPTF